MMLHMSTDPLLFDPDDLGELLVNGTPAELEAARRQFGWPSSMYLQRTLDLIQPIDVVRDLDGVEVTG